MFNLATETGLPRRNSARCNPIVARVVQKCGNRRDELGGGESRKHRVLLLALLLSFAFSGVAPADDPSAVQPLELRVTEPPADWKLSPFYKKHVSVRGFPVVASGKVSDFALLEAAYLIDRMLAPRPDVLQALIKNKVRFAVMAVTELTTEIPEHSDLEPTKYWDRRARGLGPTDIRPAVSCGEENLLGFPGDPYAAENILVHEFSHAIHLMGLNSVDKEFDTRLKRTYEAALERGLWKDKYASRNHAEYWAEGVQSWFDTNRPPDHDHNHVDTREELEEYDPDLAALIAETFRNSTWRYQRPDKRTERGHLQGYDPAQTPRFVWPPELLKWYENYQTEQKKLEERAKPQ